MNLSDLAALIAILKTAFENPNRVHDAERKLEVLQQESRDFFAYHAEFQRYVIEID